MHGFAYLLAIAPLHVQPACEQLHACKLRQLCRRQQVAASAMQHVAVAGAAAILRPEDDRLEQVCQSGAGAHTRDCVHTDVAVLHQVGGCRRTQVGGVAHNLACRFEVQAQRVTCGASR